MKKKLYINIINKYKYLIFLTIFLITCILYILSFKPTNNSILRANITADLHSSWSATQLYAHFVGIESMTDKVMNPSIEGYVSPKDSNIQRFKQNNIETITNIFNNDLLENNYTAVIIEPRKHPALEYVLLNFLKNLNNKWNIIIMHGTENIYFINHLLKTSLNQYENRITLHNLNVPNLTIADYSTLFYDEYFYDIIPTETFLIFQTDTLILEKNANKIYDFINYDYVGAPWKLGSAPNNITGCGNGGLSIRKKSKMLELLKYKDNVIENGKFGKYIVEDLFFSGNYTKNINVNKPLIKQAVNFSVETIFNINPFGIHKPWGGLSIDEYNNLIKLYPEIKILENLQN